MSFYNFIRTVNMYMYSGVAISYLWYNIVIKAIIISLFQEDNIFGTNASLTWSSITKVEMALAIEHT